MMGSGKELYRRRKIKGGGAADLGGAGTGASNPTKMEPNPADGLFPKSANKGESNVK